MVVGDQHHATTNLPPGKTWYPLYGRLGGPQGRCGQVRKIPHPTGIRSPNRPARSESPYRLSYRGPHWTEEYYPFVFFLIIMQDPEGRDNKGVEKTT